MPPDVLEDCLAILYLVLPQNVLDFLFVCFLFLVFFLPAFLGGEDNKMVVLQDSAPLALNSFKPCAPCNLFTI